MPMENNFVQKPFFQIPGGIFGPENEATLFDSINITDPVERMKVSKKDEKKYKKEQKADFFLLDS